MCALGLWVSGGAWRFRLKSPKKCLKLAGPSSDQRKTLRDRTKNAANMADFSELVITEFSSWATAGDSEDYQALLADAEAEQEAMAEMDGEEEAREGDEEAAGRDEVEVRPTTVAGMLAALREMYWEFREDYRDNFAAADEIFQELPDVPELAEAREDCLFCIEMLEERLNLVASWLAEVTEEAPADRTQLYSRADRDVLCGEFAELCEEARGGMSLWLRRIEGEAAKAMLEYKAELEHREWEKEQRRAAEFAKEHYESFRSELPHLLMAGGRDLERLLGHVRTMHQLVEQFAF